MGLLLSSTGLIVLSTSGTLLQRVADVISASSKGYDSNWDSGVTVGGDVYVATTGSNSNAGTLAAPYLTIQHAVDNSSDGDLIVIRGGTYYEAVTFNFNGDVTGRTLTRYGAEEVIVSGFETLSGFTQCSSGDQSDLGSFSGAAGEGTGYLNIYKKTGISSANVAAANLLGLNIHEDGEWLPIATDRADTDTANDYFAKRVDSMYTASSNFALDGSDNIISVTDTVNLANYTQTQLEGAGGSESRASVVLWGDPNKGVYDDITAFNASTDTLTIAGNVEAHDQDGANNKYSLVNALPSLKQGSWGFIDNGDNTFDLYIWPKDGGSPGEITYSKETKGLDITSSDNFTLQGIKIVGQAGDGNTEGNPFGNITGFNGTSKSTNLTVNQCFFGETDNSQESYGCMIYDPSGVTITNCTFKNIINGHAYLMSGLTNTTNLNLENCLFENITDTPVWHYDLVHCEFHNVHMQNCGKNAHANQFIWYNGGNPGSRRRGCDEICVYAVKTRDMGGYATWQGCTRIYIGFCDFDSEDSDGFRRSVNDQNGSGYTYTTTGSSDPCLMWNCFCSPKASDSGNPGGNQNGLTLSPSDQGVYWELYNTVAHGFQFGLEARIQVHKNNVYTGQSLAQNSWTIDVSETITTTNSDNYEDFVNADFRAKSTSTILSKSAFRCDTDFIDAGINLATTFNNVDFTKDVDGNTIDWTDTKIGPYYTGLDNWTQNLT